MTVEKRSIELECVESAEKQLKLHEIETSSVCTLGEIETSSSCVLGEREKYAPSEEREKNTPFVLEKVEKSSDCILEEIHLKGFWLDLLRPEFDKNYFKAV